MGTELETVGTSHVSPVLFDMDFMEQSITSLPATEMSGQANIGEGLSLLDELDLQDYLLDGEINKTTIHIDSLMDDACLFGSTTQSVLECSLENLEFKTTLTSESSKLQLSNATSSRVANSEDASDLSNNYINMSDSLVFGNSQLNDCETFYNLEDLMKENGNIPAKEAFTFTNNHEVRPSKSGIHIDQRASPNPACEQNPGLTYEICAGRSLKTLKPDGALSPHDKYLEMRRKNNIASRRSRQTRKEKDGEMVMTAKELEKENKNLLMKIQRLEKQRDVLKSYLLQIIANKK